MSEGGRSVGQLPLRAEGVAAETNNFYNFKLLIVNDRTVVLQIIVNIFEINWISPKLVMVLLERCNYKFEVFIRPKAV